jgi:hypothetical protein
MRKRKEVHESVIAKMKASQTSSATQLLQKTMKMKQCITLCQSHSETVERPK